MRVSEEGSGSQGMDGWIDGRMDAVKRQRQLHQRRRCSRAFPLLQAIDLSASHWDADPSRSLLLLLLLPSSSPQPPLLLLLLARSHISRRPTRRGDERETFGQ